METNDRVPQSPSRAAGSRSRRLSGGVPAAAARRGARRPSRSGTGTGRHRGTRRRRRTHRRPAARAVHDGCRIPHPRRRHRHRADRRHRAGAQLHAAGAQLRRRRDHRRTRRCWRPTAPNCSTPPSRSAPSCTTRPPSPARSRSSARCATASPATGSTASSASSTAPPTSSSTGWTPTGESLEDALAAATALGYAEADPTADIGGYDAAQKAAILASLAFHTPVPLDRVHREGITGHHPGPGGRGPQGRIRRQAARDLRAAHRPGDGSRGRQRPRLPGARSAWTTRSPPCTEPTTPCSSRRKRPATSCSTAPAPGAWRTPPPCSATWSPPPAGTSIGGPGVAESTHGEPAHPADRAGASPATRSPSTVLDRPGVLAAIATRVQPSTASRSRTSSSRCAAWRPATRVGHRYPGHR